METNETIASIANDVRVLMRDVPTELNPTPHYADETIYAGIKEGFKHMWAVRPSSRYIHGVILDQPIPSEGATIAETAVFFDERWRRGVVYYAAAICYETGTPDTVNIQMANYFKQQADAVFAS